MSEDWLVILGAGFSKAFNNNMPAMADLNEEIRSDFEDDEIWESKPFLDNIDNFELLLSYLGTDQPWKSISEDHEDKALFKKIQTKLAENIAKKEQKAFSNEIPEWSKNFAQILHDKKIPVITFNYDTVLERLMTQINIDEVNFEFPVVRLYNLPIKNISERSVIMDNTRGAENIETFNLIKLHGSISWFYSGKDDFSGEQVYYCNLDKGVEKKYSHPKHPVFREKIVQVTKDKQRLIVPPLMEKSQFYSNEFIRSLWTDAREELSNADRILSIGYSLTPTDLTTRMLLSSSSKHVKEVFIVNLIDNESDEDNEKKEEELKKHYNKTFPSETEIKDKFICEENPVSKAVQYLKENT